MSLRDVCDIAHLLLYERIEARVNAESIGVLVAAGMGAEVRASDLDTEWARLDAALCAAPVRIDSRQVALRTALGLSPVPGR